MTQPPDWATQVPSVDVNNPPARPPIPDEPNMGRLVDLREHFIEMIIRKVLEAIFGFFTPGGGSAFSQLANAFVENIPVIGQPISKAISFITQFLDPAKLLFSQNRVENPPQQGWPKTFTNGGFQWGELIATPIQLLVQNLSRIITPGNREGGNLIDQNYTTPGGILEFIEGILLPRQRMAELDDDGHVPDSQKPQSVQNIIDHAVNVAHGSLVGDTVDNPIEAFFDAVLGIFGAGQEAQSTNVVQNAKIDALLSSGASIFETFDGASADDLGSNFVQSYYDSGSGLCGRDGAGNAVWKSAGASVRGCVNRHVTALSTDTQKVALYLSTNLKNFGSDPMIKLQARCNSTNTSMVEARIIHNEVEIGYVVAGVYTRLGAVQAITGDTVGVWELKVGTTTDDREFVLYRNGVQVLTRTDSGDVSLMGASNRNVAFTMQAGVRFFWVFIQTEVGDIASFSASDRTAGS